VLYPLIVETERMREFREVDDKDQRSWNSDHIEPIRADSARQSDKRHTFESLSFPACSLKSIRNQSIVDIDVVPSIDDLYWQNHD
jgi:hypothetical protein